MKDQIKGLVVENKTQEAIQLLIESAVGTQLENEVFLLKSKFEKLQRDDRLYLASRNELSIEYNQLNDSLLRISDELFSDQLSTKGQPSAKRNLQNPSKRYNDLILTSLGGILLFANFS